MKKTLFFLSALIMAIAGYSQTAKEYYEKGNAKIKLEDNAGAIAEFTKAIEIDPNYKDAYKERGNARKSVKDYTGAMSDFAKVNDIMNTQVIKYGDMSNYYWVTLKNKNIKYASYVSKDGAIYKIGDKLKIGFPRSGKSFAFINDYNPAYGIDHITHQLEVGSSGNETEIQNIYVTGDKETGYSVYFWTKAYSGTYHYVIGIENAIAAGEIKSFGMTSDEALNNLKRAKDKLDLELITKAKYDSIKIEMVKYIK